VSFMFQISFRTRTREAILQLLIQNSRTANNCTKQLQPQQQLKQQQLPLYHYYSTTTARLLATEKTKKKHFRQNTNRKARSTMMNGEDISDHNGAGDNTVGATNTATTSTQGEADDQVRLKKDLEKVCLYRQHGLILLVYYCKRANRPPFSLVHRAFFPYTCDTTRKG